MEEVALPEAFAAFARRGEAWARFVAGTPRLVRDLLGEWELRPDGPATHGRCALVVPVRTAADAAATLKVGFVEEESEHEALALQHWHGRGAVTLLRADPRRGALLLERLTDRDLDQEWDVAACEAVGELCRDLHRPAPPPLRRLSAHAGRWAAELAGLPRNASLPRRLVEQAAHLAAGFASDPGTDGRLVHTDLHYENVLADHDGRWRAIDPKPLSGDPCFEPAPLRWNRFDELAGDVRDGVRRRFHAVIDAAGMPEERARDWVIVRMMVNARWALAEVEAGRTPDGSLRTWLTTCVAVAKAVQD
ncbi:aminoglycoside phosphotransferase family protein [Nocardioides sp.]|uniref:aminoglycoside phosphotransferase family protein n=1 Tax=Nocardioides sp. TaxID=35761 RepID=UPI0035145D04